MSETEAPQDEYTVDQLAHDAGLPVSTIRMYQQRGLIEPPEKRGRVGWYNRSHRERLRLIAQLQERGFSLAAIKETVDSWNSGQSLDDLLGVGDVVPGLASEPLRLSPAAFAKRFEGVDITQQDVQRAVAIGLAELDGNDLVIANRPFADIGPEVAQLGIPVSEMLDEYEALQQAVGDIADRFRSVFERHLWSAFTRDGKRAEDLVGLTEATGRLAQLATLSVTAELNARFASFVQDYMDEAQGEGG